jgi:hypothetical protein
VTRAPLALVVAVVAVVTALGCQRCLRHGADSSTDPTSADVDDEDRAKCDPRAPHQCVGDDVVACEPDGRFGRRIRTCKAGCRDGACVATCAQDGAELIYVVTEGGDLMSFDPRKLADDPFHVVGHLACGGRGTPFSMAVDRTGTAWVLYGGGELFAVSILDAKCRPTPFRGRGTFGMGFVSDVAGSDAETLYIAVNDGSRELDTLAVGPRGDFRVRMAGELTATDGESPELTGTAGARLFGFFPATDAPPFVQEIERTSGAALGPKWALGASSIGRIVAYAFAQWGGEFYVFVTTDDGDSTVRVVDPKTGSARVARDNLPFRITGAGVSTCAPERDGG